MRLAPEDVAPTEQVQRGFNTIREGSRGGIRIARRRLRRGRGPPRQRGHNSANRPRAVMLPSCESTNEPPLLPVTRLGEPCDLGDKSEGTA